MEKTKDCLISIPVICYHKTENQFSNGDDEMNTGAKATVFAIAAAALYAINIPLSKVLLDRGLVGATMMAAFLYLGAGFGLLIYGLVEDRLGISQKTERLTQKELPYTVAMVVLDVIAPILLMLGIARTNSANVSLLNNFEIVATSIIALIVFKEVISKRLWFAIALVTIASAILSFEGGSAFMFNGGSLLVLGASVCWGFENNCTKMISNKSSTEIVIIKGCFSGLGSLIIALVLGERIPAPLWLFATLLLGFVAYGLSIKFYIMAQKDLGAAKTSAFYSIAPFLGVAFGMALLKERPEVQFYVALAIMVISTIFMVKDSIALQHTHEHEHTHTHEHRHGDWVHTHEHTHRHTHLHTHGSDPERHEHTHQDLLNHQHTHTTSTVRNPPLV